MKVALTRGDCSVTLEDERDAEILCDAAYAQLKELEEKRPDCAPSSSLGNRVTQLERERDKSNALGSHAARLTKGGIV